MVNRVAEILFGEHYIGIDNTVFQELYDEFNMTIAIRYILEDIATNKLNSISHDIKLAKFLRSAININKSYIGQIEISIRLEKDNRYDSILDYKNSDDIKYRFLDTADFCVNRLNGFEFKEITDITALYIRYRKCIDIDPIRLKDGVDFIHTIPWNNEEADEFGTRIINLPSFQFTPPPSFWEQLDQKNGAVKE